MGEPAVVALKSIDLTLLTLNNWVGEPDVVALKSTDLTLLTLNYWVGEPDVVALKSIDLIVNMLSGRTCCSRSEINRFNIVNMHQIQSALNQPGFMGSKCKMFAVSYD